MLFAKLLEHPEISDCIAIPAWRRYIARLLGLLHMGGGGLFTYAHCRIDDAAVVMRMDGHAPIVGHGG